MLDTHQATLSTRYEAQSKIVKLVLVAFLVFLGATSFLMRDGVVIADILPSETSGRFWGAPNSTFKGLDNILEDLPKVVLNHKNTNEPPMKAQTLVTPWFQVQPFLETDVQISSAKSAGSLLGMENDPDRVEFLAECKESGAVHDLYQAPLIEFTTIPIRLPHQFCAGEMRLSLSVDEDKRPIGLGTIRQLNGFTYFIKYVAAPYLGVAIAAFFISIFLIATALLFQSTSSAYLAQILIISALGYFSYFIPTFDFVSLFWFDTILVLLTVGALALIVFSSSRRWATVDLKPILLAASFTAIVATTIYISNTPVSVRALSWSAYPAAWAVDSVIPYHFAIDLFVAEQRDLAPYYTLGSFTVTDRGFLMSGLLVALMSNLHDLRLFEVSTIRVLSSSFTIIFVQVWALIGLISFFTTEMSTSTRVALKEFPKKTLYSLTAFALCTPLIYVGIYYTWPKLFGGILSFLAIYLFTRALMDFYRERQTPSLVKASIVAFLIFAFSIEAHSASIFTGTAFAFSTITLIIWSIRNKSITSKPAYDIGLPLLLGVGLIFVLGIFRIMSSTVSETTSYGITYVLTGRPRFGLSSSEIYTQTANWYSKMSLSEWVDFRIEKLRYLFWNTDPLNHITDPAVTRINSIRSMYFTNFFMSAWPILLVGLGYVISKLLGRLAPLTLNDYETKSVEAHKALVISIWSVLGSAIIFLMIMNANPIIHHLPYSIFVSLIAAVLLMQARLSGRLFLTITGLTVLAFLVMYIAPIHRF